MEELNIHFLEEYKRLDKLCKDAYGAEKGVSTYIDQMKAIGRSNQDDWSSVLRRLIDLRHIRNQLTHDVGPMDYALCTDDDVEWLSDFHHRIMTQTDPLSLHRKQGYEKVTSVRPDTYRTYHRPTRPTGCLSVLAVIPVIFLLLGFIIHWL